MTLSDHGEQSTVGSGTRLSILSSFTVSRTGLKCISSVELGGLGSSCMTSKDTSVVVKPGEARIGDYTIVVAIVDDGAG